MFLCSGIWTTSFRIRGCGRSLRAAKLNPAALRQELQGPSRTRIMSPSVMTPNLKKSLADPGGRRGSPDLGFPSCRFRTVLQLLTECGRIETPAGQHRPHSILSVLGLEVPSLIPRLPQDGPKMAQDGPQTAQDSPRWPKMAPRWPTMAPRWPTMAPRWPKMATRGPKRAPR